MFGVQTQCFPSYKITSSPPQANNESAIWSLQNITVYTYTKKAEFFISYTALTKIQIT